MGRGRRPGGQPAAAAEPHRALLRAGAGAGADAGRRRGAGALRRLRSAGAGAHPLRRRPGGVHAARDLQPRAPRNAGVPRRGRPGCRGRRQAASRPAGGRRPGAVTDPVIEVRGLSKSFGGRRVVDRLDMTVRRGEIFGFLGPNGSGKTTSIRMLCGLLTPDEGDGRCLGYDIRREAAAVKRSVGYMTQRFSYYEDLSIRENLEFVARVYGLDRRAERVDAALRRLGLAARQEQLAGTLSGGWKQRLALAASLLHEPQLLLLDEPTAGVDPNARREFWEEIHDLAGQGITVLVSTHYMDEAERCNRLAYIAYGRLLEQGTPADLVARSGLRTWTVTGPGLAALAAELRALPAARQVVPFGNRLHVGGTDAATLDAQLAPFRARVGLEWFADVPRLEDVFIHLMQQAGERLS
ncbi:MAG: ABC transporter ATP-binding protein [Gammaproteobacteria bacterium]|nr:ABC transporter ATP-binding protein [Gammaproteobacteria bacterium]